MRSILASAVFSVCTIPCVAQRIAVSINEGGGPSTSATACCGVTYAVPFNALVGLPNGLASVSAVQFHMAAASVAMHDLFIFDSDPATGLPRNQLARGTFGTPANATGYWGAVLSTPVTLQGLNNYFLCLAPGTSLSMSATGPAGSMPYFSSFLGGPWTGPSYGPAWSFRLYQGVHSGRFADLGTGKPGTLGAPYLWAPGWPNTGNPVELVVTELPAGSPCLFLLGRKTTTVLRVATLYAQPDVTVAATGTQGFATLRFQIPSVAALHGVVLASQALVADPGAAFGISHTQGVEMTIGH